MNLIPPLPDLAAMESQFAAQRAQMTAPFRDLTQRLFPAASLGAWLRWAETAGVPYVPASAICVMPRDTLMNFEAPTPAQEAHWQAFAHALRSVLDTHMVRWDPCSGEGLKGGMADAVPFGAHARELHIDDPRAFDILYEYPLDEVTIWSRPWVRAQFCERYPVEFRVFVQRGEVLGTANYYPQRALPASDDILGYAQQAEALARTLVSTLAAHRTYPWLASFDPARFPPHEVHATLDFLVTEGGAVLFLEAGPPFGAGAHPCCFLRAPGEPITIAGLALGLSEGVEAR